MRTAIAILQSGFTCKLSNLVSRDIPGRDTMKEDILSREYRVKENNNLYNFAIDEQYNEWRTDNKVLNCLEFKESVINATIDAYGVPSLFQWIEMQNKTANITPIHIEFFNDMIQFAVTGITKIDPVQWLALIEYSSINTSKQLVSPTLINSLAEFITYMLRHPKGMEKLIIYNMIIFGSRPYITTVAAL